MRQSDSPVAPGWPVLGHNARPERLAGAHADEAPLVQEFSRCAAYTDLGGAAQGLRVHSRGTTT